MHPERHPISSYLMPCAIVIGALLIGGAIVVSERMVAVPIESGFILVDRWGGDAVACRVGLSANPKEGLMVCMKRPITPDQRTPVNPDKRTLEDILGPLPAFKDGK
jgi:hypothetical protein